jgi:HAD superfamily hydrolase (TIGR01509 family)
MPLLDWAENQGWATAVVTNAPRKNAEFMLATLHLADRLDTLVIAEELSQAKPHPMPYLEALRRLNVAPEQAIAFEDSVTGVQSAVAAGIYTLGVATTHLGTTLKEAGANQVIADFLDDGLEQFGLLAKSA